MRLNTLFFWHETDCLFRICPMKNFLALIVYNDRRTAFRYIHLLSIYETSCGSSRSLVETTNRLQASKLVLDAILERKFWSSLSPRLNNILKLLHDDKLWPSSDLILLSICKMDVFNTKQNSVWHGFQNHLELGGSGSAEPNRRGIETVPTEKTTYVGVGEEREGNKGIERGEGEAVRG